VRGEWPSRRAAEKRDELAPPHHSITSSARASSDAGTSRPSAFAVLRLMPLRSLAKLAMPVMFCSRPCQAGDEARTDGIGDAREHGADAAAEPAFHVNKIPISAAIEGRGAQEMVALVLRRNRPDSRIAPLYRRKQEVDMLTSMKSSAPEKDKSAAANAVEEIAPIAMPTLTQAEADTEMIPSLIEKVGATTIAEIDRLIAELQEAKTIAIGGGAN